MRTETFGRIARLLLSSAACNESNSEPITAHTDEQVVTDPHYSRDELLIGVGNYGLIDAVYKYNCKFGL